MGDGVIQYRYSSAVMVGSWRETRTEALLDALHAGQADRRQGKGARIVLREWVTLEEADEPRNR
jgi:hypothetical protein